MRERWEAALGHHPQAQVLENLLAAMRRKRLEIATKLKTRSFRYA